jgi:hypothetical protein
VWRVFNQKIEANYLFLVISTESEVHTSTEIAFSAIFYSDENCLKGFQWRSGSNPTKILHVTHLLKRYVETYVVKYFKKTLFDVIVEICLAFF